MEYETKGYAMTAIKINSMTRFQPGSLGERGLSYNFHCKQCHTEQPINGRKYVQRTGMAGKWWICALCAKEN